MEVFLKYWHFGFHFPESIYKVKLLYSKLKVEISISYHSSILRLKIKTCPIGQSLFKLSNKETTMQLWFQYYWAGTGSNLEELKHKYQESVCKLSVK